MSAADIERATEASGPFSPTPIAVPDGLAGLAAAHPGAIDALRTMRVELEHLSGLDERTIELVRIGTLVGLGAPAGSFASHVRRAVSLGVTGPEIWGVLLAVAPLVGVPRLIAAGPSISEAIASSAD